MPTKPLLPFSATELAAWGGLIEYHAHITGVLGEALEATHQLALPEYEVLIKLGMAEGCTLSMGALRERTYLTRSQSGLSRLVDRLCKRDLVHRRPSTEGDRRSVVVTISPTGLELVATAAQEHAGRVRKLVLVQMSRNEIDVLSALWPKLIAASRAAAQDLTAAEGSDS